MSCHLRSLVFAALLGRLVAPAYAGLLPLTTTTTTILDTTSTTETSTTSTSSTAAIPTTVTSTSSTLDTVPQTSTSSTAVTIVTTSSSTTTRVTRTTRTTVRATTSTSTTPSTVPPTSTTIAVPTSCPGVTVNQRARVATTARGSNVTLRVQLFGLPVAPLDYDPGRDGLTLRFGDQTGGVVSIPPGRPGSGCAKTDGWRAQAGYTTKTYTYRNASGALPPTCTPGSAAGVRLVRIMDALARDGTIHVRLRSRRAPVDARGNRFNVTIVLGDSTSTQGTCARLTLACGGAGLTQVCR